MKKRIWVSLLVTLLAVTMLLASCAGKSSYVVESPNVAYDASAMEEVSYTYTDPAADDMSHYGNAENFTERMLVYTIRYTMETKTFDETCRALEDKAAQLGGYVDSYDSYAGGNNTEISYSFRIPSEKLDDFTNAVENLGTVTRKNTEVTDYTNTFYDYQTEIELLNTEQDYIQQYLDEAEDYAERATLIEKLLSIRREIARLEHASKNIVSAVSYSTVDVTVREVTAYSDIKVTYGDSLVSAFKEGWEGFANFFRELFYMIVLLSPLWVACIIIFLAIFIPVKAHKAKVKKRAMARAAEQQKPKAE